GAVGADGLPLAPPELAQRHHQVGDAAQGADSGVRHGAWAHHSEGAHVQAHGALLEPADLLLLGLADDGARHFVGPAVGDEGLDAEDRKSTRLNSSHVKISYAVFCLKKKKRESIIRDKTRRRTS